MKEYLSGHEKRKVPGTKERALYRYHQMKNRCRNGNNCLHKRKGIKVLVSKEDFIEWFMANDFEGSSVDRIDPDGHYELSNMQLITMSENIGKDRRLKIKDDKVKCIACNEVKPIVEMTVDSRTFYGFRSTCKVCDNAQHQLRAIRRESSGR